MMKKFPIVRRISIYMIMATFILLFSSFVFGIAFRSEHVFDRIYLMSRCTAFIAFMLSSYDLIKTYISDRRERLKIAETKQIAPDAPNTVITRDINSEHVFFH
ncbi:hypothetical protein ACTOI6_19085 (plasmid) [Komagataeibacter intermedius]|uniref:hypothetical protein n=1 Tax=Komagataeibacter intermedius TaxID=66229 RepID=UPI004037437C